MSEPEAKVRSIDRPEHRYYQPNELSDLPMEKRRGRLIVQIMLDDLPLAAVGSAAELGLICRGASGVELVRSVGVLSVYKELTAGELQEALLRARADWDRSADLYDAAVESGSWPASWADRILVEQYATNCDLPPAVRE